MNKLQYHPIHDWILCLVFNFYFSDPQKTKRILLPKSAASIFFVSFITLFRIIMKIWKQCSQHDYSIVLHDVSLPAHTHTISVPALFITTAALACCHYGIFWTYTIILVITSLLSISKAPPPLPSAMSPLCGLTPTSSTLLSSSSEAWSCFIHRITAVPCLFLHGLSPSSRLSRGHAPCADPGSGPSSPVHLALLPYSSIHVHLAHRIYLHVCFWRFLMRGPEETFEYLCLYSLALASLKPLWHLKVRIIALRAH